MLAQAWDISREVRYGHELERLVAILEGTSDLVAMADHEGNLVYMNQAGRTLVGFGSDDDVTGTKIADYHPPRETKLILDEIVPSAMGKGFWAGEVSFCSRSGRDFPTDTVAIAHRSQEGEFEFISCIARDISELKASERQHRALVNAIPDMWFRVSVDGTYLDYKAGDTAQLIVPPDKIIGSHLSQTPLPPDVIQRSLELINLAAVTDQPQEFQYQVEFPDGLQHFECRILKCGEEECLCMVRNVTSRVKSEAVLAENLRRLKSISEQDPLTQLLNSYHIRQQLEWAVNGDRTTDGVGALLYVDLDSFKPINDREGHAVGDEVLKEVAHRIRDALRERDVVGRIGGDEFAVVLRGMADENQIAAVAQKLLDAVAECDKSGPEPHAITASIGVVLFPKHSQDPVELVKLADRAMYVAKRAGGNTFFFHDKHPADFDESPNPPLVV